MTGKRSLQKIMDLFSTKIMLYGQLRDVLLKERESLLHSDLDDLWNISDEKETLCHKIADLRRQVISTLQPDTEDAFFDARQLQVLLTEDDSTQFSALVRRLSLLKKEIESLRKENMVLIKDALGFLEALISIVLGQKNQVLTYDGLCRLNKSNPSLFHQRGG